MKTRLMAGIALFGFAALAAAAPVDPAASQVTATFRQLGVPVSGTFRKLSGDVQFDAAKPAGARALLEIEVASFDLGDKEYNAEVAKKDWFDAARFPKATFELLRVKAVGAAYEAEGTLRIKGRTAAVRFPVTVQQRSGRPVFEGRVPVSRLAFSIGEGEWKDTSLVADEVVIQFRIVALSAP